MTSTWILKVETPKGIIELNLGLNGAEAVDQAISKFQDAVTLVRGALAEKGEYASIGGRIDGGPLPGEKLMTRAERAEIFGEVL